MSSNNISMTIEKINELNTIKDKINETIKYILNDSKTSCLIPVDDIQFLKNTTNNIIIDEKTNYLKTRLMLNWIESDLIRLYLSYNRYNMYGDINNSKENLEINLDMITYLVNHIKKSH